MLKIGLTGGIGSGKSTVAKYFAKLNIPIIDADKIAHELLEPGTITYKKIVTHFGEEFLTAKKTLDRNKLRQLIFYNKKERLWLEKLIHPRIRSEMIKHIESLEGPYCIMAIPLLFETKISPKVNRILVVDCPKKNQIDRAHKRNGYSINQIKAIIATQIDRRKRLGRADDVIRNTGTIADLRKMVKKLHNYYLSLV
ncbi:dephospho-CoA kinase [Gammaproteobacteria bacterium]